MDTNQNTRGIFFIMTGMAFFSIQDSLIKFIFEDIALFELYFGRTLIQSVFLLSFVLITKKTRQDKIIYITDQEIDMITVHTDFLIYKTGFGEFRDSKKYCKRE